jgi:hypothetical protein
MNTTVSPYDTETSALIESYQSLFGKPRDPEEEDSFQTISRQLKERVLPPGKTERERASLELLDEWLLERVKAEPQDKQLQILQDTERFFAEVRRRNASS